MALSLQIARVDGTLGRGGCSGSDLLAYEGRVVLLLLELEQGAQPVVLKR